ncbi:MAG: ThiF family adenylyltransferase [Desulfatibacillaceae bacterium]|nr:ThiF family adenylyltransferase [Desulfatibacillaceae bacterium]
MDFEQSFFGRNLGVFSNEQQEKLAKSRVLIVGCGGIGGTVAVILARSGVENFELVDFDQYEPTNMNRQIACFSSSLGQNKAQAIADQINDINPDAKVLVHKNLLSLEELSGRIPSADLVFPAADDFAFSVMLFRDCQRQGVPALFVVPSGLWANVSIILPNSPGIEDLQGLPHLPDYYSYKHLFQERKYKFGTISYVFLGSWRKDYFRKFMDEDFPVAQVCPTVWMASSLGALEAVKLLSGRAKPVASPHYWSISEKRIALRRKNGLHIETVLAWQRKIFYKLFQTPLAPFMEKAQAIWWKFF